MVDLPIRDKLKVILVDLDGILCDGEMWTSDDCLNAKPIKKNIEKVNKLYMNNFVVIYTARRDHLILSTIKWLRKNNVRFHCISNNKTPADLYIDDKCVKIEDIK